MRITLNLDDDAVKIIRAYSRRRSLSLAGAASELIRKGAASALPRGRLVNGIWVVDLPKGGKKITSKRVKELESEIDLRYFT